MAPYPFQKLDDSAEELRVFILSPGEFDDTLEGEISHVFLELPKKERSTRLSLDQLRKTLLSNWEVYETLEGRYVFQNSTTETTTWTHPDPNIPRSSYEGYSDTPDSDYDPKFEALSYAWGSMTDLETLIIRDTTPSDILPQTEIPITKNLASALRYLRLAKEPRTLWIDAICINQADHEERNLQVPRMRHIYPLASRVVFWLGPATDSSPQAMSTLEYLGQQVDISHDSWYLPAPGAEQPDWFWPTNGLPYDDAIWQTLLHFFELPWFSRLWPVQESILANHQSIVQCGHDKMLWGLLRRAARCLRSKHLPLEPLQARMNGMTDTLFTQQTPLGTFTRSRGRKCSDFRDKIYGVLSLSTKSYAKRVHVNYSSTVAEVYRDACVALMDHTQRVDALRYAQLGQDMPGLLSWVPNWNSAEIDWAPPLADRPATSTTASYFEFNEPDVLTVVGVRIATIKAVGQPLTSDALQWPRVIRASWSLVSPEGDYPTGEPTLDAFVSTYIMGQDKETYPAYTFPTHKEWKELFMSLLFARNDDEGAQTMIQEYKRCFSSWCQRFAFTITREGYMVFTDGKPQDGKSAF